MLKQIGRVVTAAIMVGVLITAVTAQEPLGFTIDPTQGLPGTVVSGQVDPADVAEHCVTDLAEFQARFEALFSDPNLYNFGGEGGELFLRFFPGGTFDYQTHEQLAYALVGFTVIGLSGALGPEIAEQALPLTFVITFADIATQQLVGELGHFDPVTGEGSVVTPDVACGPWAVAAACVGPSFDIDVLEAGIRSLAPFLESLGLPPDLNEVLEMFGSLEAFIAFLQEIGQTLLQPIMVPDALGVQIFNILCVPQTKEECKMGGWEQFNQPPPGLGFKNQGQCVAFVETGRFVGTTAVTAQ